MQNSLWFVVALAAFVMAGSSRQAQVAAATMSYNLGWNLKVGSGGKDIPRRALFEDGYLPGKWSKKGGSYADGTSVNTVFMDRLELSCEDMNLDIDYLLSTQQVVTDAASGVYGGPSRMLGEGGFSLRVRELPMAPVAATMGAEA
jgi:hypothetical protein